jgi:adenylate cyclase
LLPNPLSLPRCGPGRRRSKRDRVTGSEHDGRASAKRGCAIAARLEPLAEPGGICVSSIVNESVGDRINVRFQDGGEISVKNIDRPIRVWKWHPNAASPTATRPNAAKPEPIVDAASIAVLPFINMSGDPEQEYFSDGISEDIITDLPKIGGLTVIARNSSFTYKGRSVAVEAFGKAAIKLAPSRSITR